MSRIAIVDLETFYCVGVTDEERATIRVRVIHHPCRGAQAVRRRNHLLLQVTQHIRAPPGCLAFGTERHPAPQIGQEGARIEIVSRVRNGHGTSHAASTHP